MASAMVIPRKMGHMRKVPIIQTIMANSFTCHLKCHTEISSIEIPMTISHPINQIVSINRRITGPISQVAVKLVVQNRVLSASSSAALACDFKPLNHPVLRLQSMIGQWR